MGSSVGKLIGKTGVSHPIKTQVGWKYHKHRNKQRHNGNDSQKHSMYRIFTYFYHQQFTIHVGKYTIPLSVWDCKNPGWMGNLIILSSNIFGDLFP